MGLWQEFWVGNEELVNMYERRLGDAGYMNFKLARTNNRGDGMLSYLSLFVFRLIRFWSIEGFISMIAPSLIVYLIGYRRLSFGFE